MINLKTQSNIQAMVQALPWDKNTLYGTSLNRVNFCISGSILYRALADINTVNPIESEPQDNNIISPIAPTLADGGVWKALESIDNSYVKPYGSDFMLSVKVGASTSFSRLSAGGVIPFANLLPSYSNSHNLDETLFTKTIGSVMYPMAKFDGFVKVIVRIYHGNNDNVPVNLSLKSWNADGSENLYFSSVMRNGTFKKDWNDIEYISPRLAVKAGEYFGIYMESKLTIVGNTGNHTTFIEMEYVQ